jgi:hypothetical protein
MSASSHQPLRDCACPLSMSDNFRLSDTRERIGRKGGRRENMFLADLQETHGEAGRQRFRFLGEPENRA